MRQMMFKNQQHDQSRGLNLTTQADAHAQAKSATKLNQATVRRTLRKRRSPAYMQALTHMDQLGTVSDTRQLQQLEQAVQAEFGQEVLQVPGFPKLLGIIGPCYLGGTFDVHTLDLAMNIVRHYHTNEPLPVDMEKARSLAACRAYCAIEVYSDRCCCIDDYGNATIVDDQAPR